MDAVDRWFRSKDDVRALLLAWGIDLRRADEAAHWMAMLKSAVRVSVPDIQAFESALSGAVAQRPEFEVLNGELLKEVRAAGGDHAAVLRLLNRSPVDEQLPFIERMPVVRAGEVTWRTVMEQAVVRKTLVEGDETRAALEALESLFPEPFVHEALARVRREAARESPYIVASLLTLERRVQEASGAQLQARRPHLATLRAIVEPLLADPAAEAAACAAKYLSSRDLHCPSVTNLAIAALLSPRWVNILAWWRYPFLRRYLRLLAAEVAGGSYDGGEVARRLTRLERRGVYVNTLLYPLLRLTSRAVAARR